ncbi:MAG: response regulator transcription factor [Chitinophagaceae bacterium]|nr:MAG: response regulator transcription factor [Chitinophagaceae bacterium]
MRVLIIEDEALGAERLAGMLRDLEPGIEILGPLASIAEGLDWFATHPPPDLLFLDIELSDGQSFALLSALQLRCPVIFTTAYSEHALKAFAWSSIDYLLKPVRRAALEQSLDKYRHLKATLGGDRAPVETLLAQLAPPVELRRRFLVQRGQLLRSIDSSEVAYFEGRNKLVTLVTLAGDRFAVDYTLEELETMLDGADFFRAARGFLLRAAAVALVRKDLYGKLQVQLAPPPGRPLSVSREKATAFKQWLGS